MYYRNRQQSKLFSKIYLTGLILSVLSLGIFSAYATAPYDGGDGDFAPIIEYLVDKKQLIRVIANGSRTAKELKQIAGQSFIDLRGLKDILEYTKTGLL
ncbi:MAG: hypothetical protein UT11_C0065G0007 [Berkelbacteria bacterium GW2011_GWA2_38_9]|uniref:Uncharacterized protein n=1 Tax=Berkelbacteria bacterium GW2011_GWA2_38_9 TaxID=1618334 RepID=A0A0G0NL89_9BACT|nr:MAG: hypothetical protein UT11_C0065G0007 [Berkelbacteria bacterium GW2011_GWA2_38_9]